MVKSPQKNSFESRRMKPVVSRRWGTSNKLVGTERCKQWSRGMSNLWNERNFSLFSLLTSQDLTTRKLSTFWVPAEWIQDRFPDRRCPDGMCSGHLTPFAPTQDSSQVVLVLTHLQTRMAGLTILNDDTSYTVSYSRNLDRLYLVTALVCPPFRTWSRRSRSM